MGTKARECLFDMLRAQREDISQAVQAAVSRSEKKTLSALEDIKTGLMKETESMRSEVERRWVKWLGALSPWKIGKTTRKTFGRRRPRLRGKGNASRMPAVTWVLYKSLTKGKRALGDDFMAKASGEDPVGDLSNHR